MKNYIFERYEKKYIIDEEKIDLLLPLLLSHMQYDSYCKNGAKYVIYNLYLDNENSDVIRNSVLNKTYKEKLRIRSYYIPKNENDTIFLEVKRKLNGKGNKRRIALSVKEASDFIYNHIKPLRDDYLDRQIINEMDYYFKINHVYPKVYLRYDRLALVGKDDLRITFDHNIITREDNVNLFSSDGVNILERDKYIMEIKVNGSLPLWLVKILSDLKIYSQGFSKYAQHYKINMKGYNLNGKII